MTGSEAVELTDRLIETVRLGKRTGSRFPMGFESALVALRAFLVSQAEGIQLELFTAASDA